MYGAPSRRYRVIMLTWTPSNRAASAPDMPIRSSHFRKAAAVIRTTIVMRDRGNITASVGQGAVSNWLDVRWAIGPSPRAGRGAPTPSDAAHEPAGRRKPRPSSVSQGLLCATGRNSVSKPVPMAQSHYPIGHMRQMPGDPAAQCRKIGPTRRTEARQRPVRGAGQSPCVEPRAAAAGQPANRHVSFQPATHTSGLQSFSPTL